MTGRAPGDGPGARDAFEALRHADPAAGHLAPREQIRGMIQGPAPLPAQEAGQGAPPPGDAATPAGGSADPARETGRGRRLGRKLWGLAASVAALAVAGGIGFAVGNAQSLSSDASLGAVSGRAAADAPQGTGEVQAAVPSGEASDDSSDDSGDDSGDDAGDAASDGGPAAQDGQDPGAGQWRYTSAQLPAGPGTAQVYGFDTPVGASATVLSRTAAALGLSGEPVRGADGSVTIKTGQASASVSTSGEAEFRYAQAGGPAGATPVSPAPGEQAAPARAAAIARVTGLLRDAGLNPGDFQFGYMTGGGPDATVIAQREIGGIAIGRPWVVSLTASGITAATGPLAPVRGLGAYRVISPDDAVGLITDPSAGAGTLTAYGAGSWPVPGAQAGGVLPITPAPLSPGGAAGGGTPAPMPAPGAPITWPAQDRVITGARLALAPLSQPSGAELAVPVWVLTDGGHGSWTVLALAPGALTGGG